jgi:hypothetical protein
MESVQIWLEMHTKEQQLEDGHLPVGQQQEQVQEQVQVP